MTNRRRLALVALLLSAALLVACSKSSKPSTSDVAVKPSAPQTSSASPVAVPAPPNAAPMPTAAPAGSAPDATRSSAQKQATTATPPGLSNGPSDMTYQDYGINPVVATAQQPFSTFGVDVDTASYTLTRDYLKRGTLPPPEAVRAEEFINYFPQGYPAPVNQAVGLYAESAPSPFRPSYQLVQVSLKAREVQQSQRLPAVLTLVVDTSGSMADDGKLEMVKDALQLLLDQLGPRDRVAIVAYSTSARTVIGHTNDKAALRRAVDLLQPESSTNAEAGLALGYDLASRAFNAEADNRVILASDGVANEGQTTSDAILKRVADYRGRNIYLTTVGVGMREYNDVLLEQLADKGNGNYYYVDSADEARRIFVGALTGTLETVAKDVKVQVQFSAENVSTYRLVGYENRVMANQDFRNDRVDSGDMGAGQAVTALYELQVYPGAKGNLGTVTIRYKEPASSQPMELSLPIRTYPNTIAPARVRWTAAVAEFAGVLRSSPWARETSMSTIWSVAKQAATELDETEPRREFLDLIRAAQGLRAGR